MAETELAIVVRARDQLTATLRQMGTTVDELARKVAADFQQAGRAADILRGGVVATATAAGGLAAEVSKATTETQRLGASDTSRLEVAISNTRVEVERLRAAAATDLIPGEPAARAAALEQELRNAQQALDSLKKSGAEIDIATRIAQAEQAVESLGQNASLQPLEAEIARAEVELARMRDEATRAKVAISDLDRQRMDRLSADIGEGKTKVVELRGAIDQARSGASLLGSTFTTVGAGIKSALLPILPILTLAGAAFAATRSVSEALALEDALSRINAEADLTATELDSLRRGALDTARALGLSEADAAPALLAAVTDGAIGAADGLDRFSSSARLAAALGADVAKTVDLQTSILNAYRDASLSAARSADVTFGIIRGGKVEIEELSGSLDAVLPLAAQLGVSFEELGAVIVTATQRGGGFAQGMQAVRAVLGALTDAGPEARAALEGVDFSSARIRGEGLVPVLADISAKLNGNAEAIRAVFPDGRAFGAVLALVKDEGAGLTAALDGLANSGGAVEQALGRRMRDPVFQLGVLFNSLRSSFAEAFGGAFLRGIQRAIDEMGGMEQASRTVAEVARTIGEVFGAVMPAVGAVVGQAADSMKRLIDSFGGVDSIAAHMRLAADALAGILGSSLKIAKAEIEALIRTILLIPQTVLAIKNGVDPSNWFGGVDGFKEEAEIVRREIAAVEKALLQISGKTFRFGTFKQGEVQEELRAIADELGSFKDDPATALRFKPEVDEGDLRRTLDALKGKQATIEVDIENAGALDSLSEKVRAIQDSLAPVGDAVKDLGSSVVDLGAAFVNQIPPKVQRTAEEVRSALSEIEGDIRGSQAALTLLGGAARRSFAELTGPDLDQNLASLAEQARAAELALGADRKAAQELRAELEGLISLRLGDLQSQLREAETGFVDAKRQAALLGLTDPSQVGRAVEAIGAQSDEAAQKVEALRAEIVKLTAERQKLSGRAPEVQAATAQALPRLDFRALADQYRDAFRDLWKRIGDEFDPTTVARLGTEAGKELRERILAGVGSIDPFEETLQLFRGGIEPSLDRQVQLIEEQAQRQRDATDELRQALPLLRAMGLLTEERVDLLDDETDRLSQSADILRRRAALERAGLERQALELGISVQLDDAEMRVQVDEARDRLERENLAIRLGVEVDDAAIVDAQRELQRRASELEVRQLERDAIHFGLAIDGRAPEQLRADIADAQDEAQAFADGLRGRGVRGEALALQISIDGKSTDQIEQEIAELHTRAEEYIRANPIEADLLRGAIDGGSRAFADFITGAKSGKEALRDFFTSMAAQAAQAAAQLLIVKTLISAFGASSGAGSFLTTLLPGASAKGNAFAQGGDMLAFATWGALTARSAETVMAFARGGQIRAGVSGIPPASAGGVALLSHLSGALPTVRAYAQGGTPLWVAPTAVEHFAMGGSPWMERIVDRPTLERSERLAGAAIVPLSGGGVATTDGGRLPVERRGSELVVLRPQERDTVQAYARGGAPLALFGEAGREGVMRMHQAQDGRPGIRAADGAVLPLTRVEGGRLGVEAHAAGQLFGGAERFALGGAVERDAVHAFARGGAPTGNRGNLPATPDGSLALGGLPHVTDAVRAVRTMVAPYALGGAPDASRALWTAPQAFEAGGVPDVRRFVQTVMEPFGSGGVPALERGYAKPTPVEAFAIGGRPSNRAPAAFPIGGATPASAIRASTPMQPTAGAAQAVVATERGSMTVEISPQIQLTVNSLDPKTAADVILSQRKVIVQALAEELARSPAVRAAIRGDRS